jgi:two-component system, chemotaxis family, protein-glutamate methylesterase/glutaminase
MGGVRVAVADDSSFLRKAVARLLSGEPDIELVGSAPCGEELLANLERWSPDAVILDLSMPGMGGLATLDQIMARRPIPVIILSTHSRRGAPQTIEALHRGAMDFLDKQQFSLVDFDALRQALVGKIREVTAAAAVAAPVLAPAPASKQSIPLVAAVKPRSGAYEAVFLGASTGGPLAIETILRELDRSVPVPLVVVQHMPAGFTRAFADRLNAYLSLAVREPTDGEPLRPGTVYIAPGGLHLRIARDRGDNRVLRAALSLQPESAPHRPSVDVLFASAVEVLAERCIAILLTGMGQDGAAGMVELARRGAHTIAQDEGTSAIFGMPRAAIAAGGARETLPLPVIAARLQQLLAEPVSVQVHHGQT